MAENLNNKHIYETYHSLIKTGDNLPIDDTLKVLSDGDGNELPIEVSVDTTKFKEGSTADFTDVTIIGAEGFQGPQGPQGVAGTQGPQGTNGIDGAQGPQGAQGINGVDGAQGAQGAQGINGVDGAQGAQGPQGTNGVDGAQGAQGPQGFQGSVGGVAINDVTPGTVHTGNMVETIIDTILVPANTVNSGDIFNYLARIGGTKTISNNTTIRAYINNNGAIGGQTLISTGFNIATTNTQATINRYFYVNQANGTGLGTQIWNASGISEITASPVNFIQTAIDWTVDQYIVLTAQLAAAPNTVSCTGATFFNTAGAKGDQGPQGPGVGAQGAQGPTGSQGLTGPQGNVGPTGPTGNQGSQGPAGVQGPTGLTGDQGFQGPAGVDGTSTGQIFYLNESVTVTGAFKELSPIPTAVSEQTVPTSYTPNQTVLVSKYLTPQPLGVSIIPAGIQQFKLHFTKDAVINNIEVYARVYVADVSGNILQLIGQSGNSPIGWNVNNTNPVEVNIELTLPTTAIDPNAHILVEIYGQNLDNQNRNTIFYTEGASYYSYIISSLGATAGSQGPQGPDGPQGPQGIEGPQGFDGPTGAQGPQGPQGITGAQGLTGPQGDQGANSTVPGPQGTQGPQGPSGGGSTTLTYSGQYGTGLGSNSGNDGPYTFFTNTSIFYPINVRAGQKFSTVRLVVRASGFFNSGDVQVAIYNAQDNASIQDMVATPYQKLSTTFNIPCTTSGQKNVTGDQFVFPTDGLYYIGLYVPGVWDGAFQSNATNTWSTATSILNIFNMGNSLQTNTVLKPVRWNTAPFGLRDEYSNNPPDVSTANTNITLLA